MNESILQQFNCCVSCYFIAFFTVFLTLFMSSPSSYKKLESPLDALFNVDLYTKLCNDYWNFNFNNEVASVRHFFIGS